MRTHVAAGHPPTAVAAAVVLLASSGASFITGQGLYVDGGRAPTA